VFEGEIKRKSEEGRKKKIKNKNKNFFEPT
jgi:hypothetical protein